MAEGGGFEPPVTLTRHIGLANRRTKPGYATPPRIRRQATDFSQQTKTTKNYYGLIFILPPILPLFVYIALQFFGFSQTLSFLIGVFFSIILLYFLTKISIKEYWCIIKRSFTWRFIAAIFGIMIFREMFEATQANKIIANCLS